MLHNETLKRTAWNSERSIPPLEPAFAFPDGDDTRYSFKLADDCIGAQFENGGDFGGSEVFGFHAFYFAPNPINRSTLPANRNRRVSAVLGRRLWPEVGHASIKGAAFGGIFNDDRTRMANICGTLEWCGTA